MLLSFHNHHSSLYNFYDSELYSPGRIAFTPKVSYKKKEPIDISAIIKLPVLFRVSDSKALTQEYENNLLSMRLALQLRLSSASSAFLGYGLRVYTSFSILDNTSSTLSSKSIVTVSPELTLCESDSPRTHKKRLTKREFSKFRSIKSYKRYRFL